MKRWVWLPTCIVIGVALIWLFGIGTPGAMNFPRPFDSESWKAARAGSYVRCAMVTDLRHRVGLTGKTASEVIQLLGKDADRLSDPPRVYELCPSLADYYILEIKWVGGRVESTIVRDT